MRWPNLSRRSQQRSRRRLRFEPLEDRRLMACLAVGVTLDPPVTPADNMSCTAPDQPTTPIQVGKVGEQFTLQIRVRDVRSGNDVAKGVIALPLHVSWDPDAIELNAANLTDAMIRDVSTPPVTVTPNLPLQRSLDAFVPAAPAFQPTAPPPTPADFLPFANLQNLRGGAVPNAMIGAAIGVDSEDEFSSINLIARKATIAPDEPTHVTIRLAGSMSFADAAVLEDVVPGSNTTRVDAITVQARLQIDPVNLSGIKFNDMNNNGLQDGNEPGLSGWTIRLIRDQNLDGVLDDADPEITTTTTAGDGSYQLAVMDAGTYFVREVQQAGWVQTTQNPAAITTSGVDVTDLDFGNVRQNNSLSGFVFADTNLNRNRDLGEDGLPNVMVQLLRKTSRGGNVVETRTTVTGPDGWYHFEDVAPGIYDVVEVQPTGFVSAGNSPGFVFPLASPDPLADRGTADGANAIRDIDLSGGGNAVDYNFGDNVIPTKRRFVASVDPFAETCSVLKLTCVTVRGTDGDDQIDFSPDTDVVQVTVNDQPPQEFSRATVNIVKIDALAGDDRVTLNGSSADDVAHFQSNACTIQFGSYRAGDYAVITVNAEQTIANGGSGDDLAVFDDSAVDDVLTATNEPFIGPVTELDSMLNMKRFARALAFERTRAASVPREGIDETDTATLNGVAVELVGKWQTAAEP